jgi:hypothetical protein
MGWEIYCFLRNILDLGPSWFEAATRQNSSAGFARQTSSLTTTEGVFSFFKILKILRDSPSHQIFRRMHEALNIGKK